MRELLADYYNGNLSRRRFLNRLAATGMTAAAARSIVESADAAHYSDDVLLAPRPGFSQADVNRQFTKISWEVRDARPRRNARACGAKK